MSSSTVSNVAEACRNRTDCKRLSDCVHRTLAFLIATVRNVLQCACAISCRRWQGTAMNESEQRAPCEVREPVARAELERLLSDPRFHGTERARSILQYLAERRFDGQDDAVKAYT